MGEHTKIEWTHTRLDDGRVIPGYTFNPWMGCTKVSPGCKNCYAERDMDHHWKKVQWGPGKPRVRTSEANWKKPLAWNRKAEKEGVRPKVFCASLADWLDPGVPSKWLADLLELIVATPHLDWLLLTKRPERWQTRLTRVYGAPNNRGVAEIAMDWLDGQPPQNVWLGWTTENQEYFDQRKSHGVSIPAQFHFVSAEPLLGAIDKADLSGIDWVICGGESGPNARPMHPDWARSLREQCTEVGVSFFFKQWGEYREYDLPGVPHGELTTVDANTSKSRKIVRTATKPAWVDPSGRPYHRERELPLGVPCRLLERVGKKAAGRLLDGVEHNGMPEGLS